MGTTAQPGTVAVVGSLNADLTIRTERFPEPGETLSGSELVTAPGGKSSNQAAAAARLGSQVRLVGAVGDDTNGQLLLDAAAAVGVDVTGVQRLGDHATGSAMIVVDADGENTIIVSPGANGSLSPEMVTAESLQGAAVLCLCLEVEVPTVLRAAQLGHDAGAQVLLNLSPFRDVPAELLALVDVLLVNRAEAGRLLGDDSLGTDWQEAGRRFAELGLDRVIVTLGADGSVVLDATAAAADRVSTIDGIRVEVVDTTGCGDAFTGAVAHQLAAGASLVDAARFAGRVSALAATAAGAQSSYAAFVELDQ
ncbi:MAG: ribokinase [Propionibacteriaceae bacterium]